MVYCTLNNNKISNFHIQLNMSSCYLSYNRICEFPIQQNNSINNVFPKQPKMLHLNNVDDRNYMN